MTHLSFKKLKNYILGNKTTKKKDKKEKIGYITSDPKKIKELYIKGEHKELARMLPHIRDIDDDFIKRLAESRLTTMGSDLIDLKPITLGTDPEFILKDVDTGEVTLFSSDLAGKNDRISMSEASLGADYGLLELRPAETTTVKDLLKNIKQLTELFRERFTDTKYKLAIYEIEAVIFDHKKERIRALIINEEVDFGGGQISKFHMSGVEDISVDDETSYLSKSISAYDEPLMFPERTDLLTAGGHIHIGGTFVRMLSIEQLKGLIRKIEEEIYDTCIATETPAGALRREVYGHKGEFRIKPYGVEYRTLSNSIFWPKNEAVLEEVLKKIFDITTTFFKD